MGRFRELLEDSEIVHVPRNDYFDLTGFLTYCYSKNSESELVLDGQYFNVDPVTHPQVSIGMTRKTKEFLDDVMHNYKIVRFKTQGLCNQVQRYSANTYDTNLRRVRGDVFYGNVVDISKRYDVLFSRVGYGIPSAYCATQEIRDDLVKFSKMVTTNKQSVRDAGYSKIKSLFGDNVKVKKAAAEGEYYVTSDSNKVRAQVFVRNDGGVYINKVQIDSMVDDKIASAIRLLM